MDTIELPKELVDNAITKLRAFNRRQRVMSFCKAADSLGFTKNQVIEMLKKIPEPKRIISNEMKKDIVKVAKLYNEHHEAEGAD